MPTVIKGQPTSAEVLERLRAEGRPVLLAFSCGKDSLGAWCALRDAGIEVVPAYLWYLPHLAFVDEELEHYERLFGTKIHRYPHPSFYRMVAEGVDQTPARLRAIAISSSRATRTRGRRSRMTWAYHRARGSPMACELPTR